MGDRGDLLRALILALPLAGCFDFVEPDLPQRGAPAVARLTVSLSDSGTVSLDGLVAPGLAADGFPREVRDPTVIAVDLPFLPADSADDLRYSETRTIDPGLLAAPGIIRGPELARTRGTPTLRFRGLARLDGDTVALEADGSLRLHMEVGTVGAVADVRQWFLTLTGDTMVFRLSSDGPPPPVIDVPARWVPGDAPFVTARLIYQQSSRIQTVVDYIGLYVQNLELHWIVRTDRP